MTKYIPRILVAIILGLIMFARYYPIKTAVKESDIECTGEYVICNPAYSTGFEWGCMSSSTMYEGGIFIEGALEKPRSAIKYDVLPNNSFIFYGEFIGERDSDVGKYPVFRAKNWDIIAPVKRNTIFPNFLCPQYGLSWVDFYH
jgi:hypothetical protein